MNERPGVVTVGSINIDLVAKVSRRPEPGETFPGESFEIGPGGKGLNQAVAAALSGARSFMVARLGTDLFAEPVYELLRQSGVDHRHVIADPAGTGVGNVVVDGNGDYSAIIVARANGRLSPADVDVAADAFDASRVLLLQLEVPMATVVHAAQVAKRKGLMVFLNAAPTLPVPPELLDNTDVLLVNEIEAGMMAGLTFDPDDAGAIKDVMGRLSVGKRDVVLTLGPRGAFAMGRDGRLTRVPGHKVTVANTLGAGDAFIGELAARVAEGMSLFDALPYANAAGAIAVQRLESHGIGDESDRIQALVASKEE